MTAAEFMDWQAYSKLEPFGERRADQRAWMQAMAAMNIAGMKPPAKLADILPEWRPPADPDDAARALMQWIEGQMEGAD